MTIREMGQGSAVSIYHHTARVGPLVGTVFGDTLRDEVNALLASLEKIAVGTR